MGLPGSPFPPMFGEPKSASTPAKPASASSAKKSGSYDGSKYDPAFFGSTAGYISHVSSGDPSNFNAKTDTQGLIGTLSLPRGLTASAQFVWDYNTNSLSNVQDLRTGGRNASQSAGYNPHTQSMTTMTMAGAVSYMKSLAVNDPTNYEIMVHQLVAAGYLSPSSAIYRGYSIEAGNAFLKSAADVWAVNQDKGAGATVRWADLVNQRIQSRQESGLIDANGLPVSGSGGSGAQGPVRQDQYTDPATVKASINSAAKSVLGRNLTDAEAASFASAFHGQESAWNDQSWAAQQAHAAGQTSSVTNSPSVSAAAKDYVDTAPALGGERTHELLGSYIGVLRNMVGLGSGGVSSAVS